jgi:hypothetical protein
MKKKSGFQADWVHARDRVVQRKLRAATVVRAQALVRAFVREKTLSVDSAGRTGEIRIGARSA